MAKTPEHTPNIRPARLGEPHGTPRLRLTMGWPQLTWEWHGKHSVVHWYTPNALGYKPSMATACPVAPTTLSLHKKQRATWRNRDWPRYSGTSWICGYPSLEKDSSSKTVKTQKKCYSKKGKAGRQPGKPRSIISSTGRMAPTAYNKQLTHKPNDGNWERPAL